MGQSHYSKVYIDPNHNGNHNGISLQNEHYISQKSLEKQHSQQHQPPSPHQPNMTIIPITSFKNKLRVYQNFETSEVLVLLDSDINEFPGFTKSEAAEWYEVTISHLQEKYYNYFSTQEHSSSSSSPSHSRDQRFSSTQQQQIQQRQKSNVKKFTAGATAITTNSSSSPRKEKNVIEIQPIISPLRLNLSQNILCHSSSSSGSGGVGDREKVDLFPPLQVQQAVPTHTISSLLTTPHNDSYSIENYEQQQQQLADSEMCPFCKEYLNDEDGSKHVCDCIVSHNIEEIFQESDKLLQEVCLSPCVPHSFSLPLTLPFSLSLCLSLSVSSPSLLLEN
jgi:hypothetical protein